MSDDKQDTSTDQRSPGELLNELDSLKELLDEEHESVAPYTSIDDIGSVEEYLRLKQQAAAAELSIEDYLNQQTAVASDELELLDNDTDDLPLLDEVYTIEEDEPLARNALSPDVAEEEESQTPTAAEATSVEEYFAAVVAAKHPQQALDPVVDEVVTTAAADEAIPLLNEVVHADTIPVLDEIVTSEAAIPVLDEVAVENSGSAQSEISLEDMQELVDLIVNRKLQHLKPKLEQEVMGEIQKLLPLSTFTKS
ncbi:MAG: hypothetical protein ABFS08_01230 [Pseudomonadota bacterium]